MQVACGWADPGADLVPAPSSIAGTENNEQYRYKQGGQSFFISSLRNYLVQVNTCTSSIIQGR